MPNDGNSPGVVGARRAIETFNRRRFLKATGAGALAAGGAGCIGGTGGDGGDGDGITLGALVAMPGDFAGGTAHQEAAELAVQQINDDAGLLDQEVDLIVKDTELDPATSRSKYRELVLDEQVDATVGLFGSEEGLAVAEEIPKHETLHIFAGVADTAINDQIRNNYDQSKYMFRAMYNGVHYGRNLAAVMDAKWEDWGFERIGVAVEDIEGFTNTIKPTALDNAPDFVEVEFEQSFSVDTSDFAPILDQAEDADIDMLFAFVSQAGAGLTAEWAQRQPDFHYGGADVHAGEPAQWENTDGVVEGVWSYVGGGAPGVEPTERTGEMIAAHEEMHGHVPQHAQGYTMYDSVMAWKEAVETAETTNSDELIPVLEQDVEFEATTGMLSFQEQDGEFPHDPVFGDDGVQPPIMQWQEVDGEGQQVGLWPDAVKTGELQDPPWF
ncbi:ABC transporter substrate-binding protein [Natrialbaceae archaeon GCM10025810]|uniref:ABC transporter substrate-binding protein n=1 Tax=Halovalidus salilacus TaxID=3075124 RepID=UPI00360F0125